MFSFAKKIVDKFEGGTGARPENPASYFHKSLTANNGGYGLRVLHVDPKLEGHVLGFEAWFDFIVGVNGHDLPMKHTHAPNASSFSYSIGNDGTVQYGGMQAGQEDPNSVVDFDLLAQELAMVARGPDRTASFQVWSAKGGITRTIYVELHPADTETDTKAEEDTENAAQIILHAGVFRKLGLTVASMHLSSATHVWKILNTHLDSPAWRAQLVPLTDYIIGCDSAFPSDIPAKGLLAGDSNLRANAGAGGEHLLAKTVAAYYERHHAVLQDDKVPILLYVYNQTFDVLRPVTVYLSRGWAPAQNKGLLGCDVGYGLLHRLPEVSGKFNTSEHNGGRSVVASERNSVELGGAREALDSLGAFSGYSDQHSEQTIVDQSVPDANVPAVNSFQKQLAPPPSGPQTSSPRKSKLSDRYAPVPGVTETPTKRPLEVNTYSADVKDSQLETLASPIHFSSHKSSAEPVTEISLVDPPLVFKEEASTTNKPEETSANETVSVAKDHTLSVAEGKQYDQESSEEYARQPEIVERDHTEEKNLLTEPRASVNISETLPEKIEESTKPEEVISQASKILDDTSQPVNKSADASECAPSKEEEIVQNEKKAELSNSVAERCTTQPETKSIDLLLDEDEDFLDQCEEIAPVSAFDQDKVSTSEAPMCDISLNDPSPLEERKPSELDFGISHSPKNVASPISSSSPPQPQVFSPMKVNTSLKSPTIHSSAISVGAPAGQTLVPPMVKPGRRRKSHTHGNISNLTDFMNEELSKSKANDVKFNSPGPDDAANGLPPPPPKSLRRS